MLELHVLTVKEEAFTLMPKDVIEADAMIAILGEKFSEVRSLTLVYSGTVLHQQSFV